MHFSKILIMAPGKSLVKYFDAKYVKFGSFGQKESVGIVERT